MLLTILVDSFYFFGTKFRDRHNTRVHYIRSVHTVNAFAATSIPCICCIYTYRVKWRRSNQYDLHVVGHYGHYCMKWEIGTILFPSFARILPWLRVQFIACNAVFVQQLQAFQHDGKYLWGENVAAMNIFHDLGKPAITAQKLQRVACNKLYMKPRHYAYIHIYMYTYMDT